MKHKGNMVNSLNIKSMEEETTTSTAANTSIATGRPNDQIPSEQAIGHSTLESNFFALNWVKQMASEVVETVHKFATEDTIRDEAEYTEEIRLGAPGGRRTLLDQVFPRKTIYSS